jgi:hypothetical protein
MKKFIFVTFVFMGWAFYEMSGGADFDAEQTRLSRSEAPVAPDPAKAAPIIAQTGSTLPENVTRVALDLNSVQDVVSGARTLPNIVPGERTLETQRVTVSTTPEASQLGLSEEEPAIILPSLLVDKVVITPVDFNSDTPAPRDDSEIRSVSGNSVNVRGGPGTGYSVVNRLVRGDEVEILQDPGQGWVKLRPVDVGPIGWMASFLLTEG